MLDGGLGDSTSTSDCFGELGYAEQDSSLISQEGSTSGVYLYAGAEALVDVELAAPGGTLPPVATLPPSQVTATAAVLEGLENPNGHQNIC